MSTDNCKECGSSDTEMEGTYNSYRVVCNCCGKEGGHAEYKEDAETRWNEDA